MNKIAWMLVISLSQLSCTTNQVQEKFLMQPREFVEPKDNFATVVLEAPTLTKVMWVQDRISVKFYSSCSTSNWKDDEYLGEVDLSTDPKVGKTKEIKVPAGNLLYLEMGHMGDVQCAGKHSWVPQRGSKYRFTYNLDGWRCNTLGVELGAAGKASQIHDLATYKNDDGFFSSSGSTSPAWRKCGKVEDHRVK